MKKLLFLISFLICSYGPAFAQNGPAVNAMCTIGPFGNEFQLGYDYKWNRFSIGIGVAYLTSSFRQDSLAIPYPNAYNYNQEYQFRHVIVPINFGYYIPMGSRFFMIPMVSLGVSYNTSAKYLSWTDYYENLYERRLTSDEFIRHYHRSSLWAGLALRFSYRATNRINILAALHGKGTVTTINKIKGEDLRSSSGGLSLGLQYQFVAN